MYRVSVLCVIVLIAAVCLSCIRSRGPAPEKKRSGPGTYDTSRLPGGFPCTCAPTAPLCRGAGPVIESAPVPVGDPAPAIPPMAVPPQARTPTLDRLTHQAAREAYRLRHGAPAPGCMPTRWVLAHLR